MKLGDLHKIDLVCKEPPSIDGRVMISERVLLQNDSPGRWRSKRMSRLAGNAAEDVRGVLGVLPLRSTPPRR
jgi:hypothetical protein